MSTMGDAAQESGESRLQFTISFCGVRRSEVGNDCSGAVKQWRDGSDGSEAVERGATAPLHRGVMGDRVAPFVNHALTI